MSGKENILVRSSWIAGNDRSLKDAVCMTPKSEFKCDDEEGLTDVVQLETCVLLMRQVEENGNEATAANPCSLDLRVASGASITRVIVISEARVIEVYGACGEYLTTVAAQFLDEVDDVAVYCADITLVQPSPECSLRFARLKRESQMWLYGVRVIWMDDPGNHAGGAPMSQGTSLNFKAVEQRLTDSGATLSDKAQSCKQFLKMYGSSFADGRVEHTFPVNPLNLLTMLASSNESKAVGRGAGEGVKNTMSLLKSVSRETFLDKCSAGDHQTKQKSSATNPSFIGERDVTEVEAVSKMCLAEQGTCSSCMKSFESMLDKKLHLLQISLLASFDERIGQLQCHLQQHQDQWFAKVMNLLEGRATFDDSGPCGTTGKPVQGIINSRPEVTSLDEIVASKNNGEDDVRTRNVFLNSKNEECQSLQKMGDMCSSGLNEDDASGQKSFRRPLSESLMQTVGSKFLTDLNINANSSDLTENFDVKCEQAIRSMMERFQNFQHSIPISQVSRNQTVPSKE